MPTKAAVRARPSGRTGHLKGGEVDAMIVINGEDTDEADSVAAATAAVAAAIVCCRPHHHHGIVWQQPPQSM